MVGPGDASEQPVVATNLSFTPRPWAFIANRPLAFPLRTATDRTGERAGEIAVRRPCRCSSRCVAAEWRRAETLVFTLIQFARATDDRRAALR